MKTEQQERFPIDWSQIPEEYVCAAYNHVGIVVAFKELVRERPEGESGSIYMCDTDGLSIVGYPVMGAGKTIGEFPFDYRGSVQMRPEPTYLIARMPLQDRWNTTCDRCGKPAYAGLCRVECSAGCGDA